MAGFASLCMEMAYLGTPSISFYNDPSGALENRSARLLIDSTKTTFWFESIPIVTSNDELIWTIRSLLINPEKREEITKNIVDA